MSCRPTSTTDIQSDAATKTLAVSLNGRLGKRSPEKLNEAARVMACNGTTRSSLELQNRAVVANLYKSFLPKGVGDANGLRSLVREPAATSALSSEERQTVETATDQMTRVIHNTPTIAVEKGIREFKVAGWEVNGDNMEEEFREVERRTFADGIHWGRVIAFLAFSVSFAAYVSSRGISGGAQSVFEWTNQVLDGTLGEFMKKENGWVSGGLLFLYIDKYNVEFMFNVLPIWCTSL